MKSDSEFRGGTEPRRQYKPGCPFSGGPHRPTCMYEGARPRSKRVFGFGPSRMWENSRKKRPGNTGKSTKIDTIDTQHDVNRKHRQCTKCSGVPRVADPEGLELVLFSVTTPAVPKPPCPRINNLHEPRRKFMERNSRDKLKLVPHIRRTGGYVLGPLRPGARQKSWMRAAEAGSSGCRLV
jgi:hypothetical protein